MWNLLFWTFFPVSVFLYVWCSLGNVYISKWLAQYIILLEMFFPGIFLTEETFSSVDWLGFFGGQLQKPSWLIRLWKLLKLGFVGNQPVHQADWTLHFYVLCVLFQGKLLSFSGKFALIFLLFNMIVNLKLIVSMAILFIASELI